VTQANADAALIPHLLKICTFPREGETLAAYGSRGGIRTPDQAVNSRLLYH
jgi:hypothetical protein